MKNKSSILLYINKNVYPTEPKFLHLFKAFDFTPKFYYNHAITAKLLTYQNVILIKFTLTVMAISK